MTGVRASATSCNPNKHSIHCVYARRELRCHGRIWSPAARPIALAAVRWATRRQSVARGRWARWQQRVAKVGGPCGAGQVGSSGDGRPGGAGSGPDAPRGGYADGELYRVSSEDESRGSSREWGEDATPEARRRGRIMRRQSRARGGQATSWRHSAQEPGFWRRRGRVRSATSLPPGPRQLQTMNPRRRVAERGGSQPRRRRKFIIDTWRDQVSSRCWWSYCTMPADMD
jgi:hypothetical protein